MKFSFLFLLVAFLFISSCSGVKFLSSKNPEDFYSKEFLTEINKTKEKYRGGYVAEALADLQKMDESVLTPNERALRRNLIGVILFSQSSYEKAIFNFDLALSNVGEDQYLESQLHLNLASSYFKLGFMEKAYEKVLQVNHSVLNEAEATKSHKLLYLLSKELGHDDMAMAGLIRLLSKHDNLLSLKADENFEQLTSKFFSQSPRERIRFIEEFEEEGFIAIGYLGYLESEKLYYSSSKDEARSLLEWVKDRFSKYKDIEKLVTNFYYRIENYKKIDQFSVGVVLPLTGEKAEFGKRALNGIDLALKELSKNTGKKFDLFIMDSKGSGAIGSVQVKKLIEEKNVSAIVGGLFGVEGLEEYKESKKHGVLFISLSQIFTPKEDKDHLLIEIPGSVESLITRIFSEELLNFFGRRAAIMYPDSKRGEAYLNEFWRVAKARGVKITGLIDYEKSKTDYRDVVQNILGLKYKRIRQEELDLLTDIHKLEKSSSIRRIQNLKPQVDFDWIFVPSFPKDALQLIPSFSYFDAFNLNIIGDSSWRTQRISKESSKFGKIYFVGDNVNPKEKDFISRFISLYKKKPKLIEMRSYDAMLLLGGLISSETFESRDQLDLFIKSKESLDGVTGNWVQEGNLWLKKMAILRFNRGKIEDLKKVLRR